MQTKQQGLMEYRLNLLNFLPMLLKNILPVWQTMIFCNLISQMEEWTPLLDLLIKRKITVQWVS